MKYPTFRTLHLYASTLNAMKSPLSTTDEIRARVASHCDGAGPHSTFGPIHKLPTGGGGNLLLCRECFDREIVFRKLRNQELSADCRFVTPEWVTLERYPVNGLGCGEMITPGGLNGGVMPCGDKLTWLCGSETIELCAGCSAQLKGGAK